MAFDRLPAELIGAPSEARGDILVRGATAWQRLAKGSAGQVLVQGANDPAWGWRGWVQHVSATFDVATKYTSSGHLVTITTNPPASTEGFELLTATITPKHASHKLIVRASVPFQMFNGTSTAVLMLCRDADVDALKATWHEGDPSTNYTHEIQADIAAGSTSAQTFKLRMGQTANVDFVVNGLWDNVNSVAVKAMGASMHTWLTVDEFAP